MYLAFGGRALARLIAGHVRASFVGHVLARTRNGKLNEPLPRWSKEQHQQGADGTASATIAVVAAGSAEEATRNIPCAQMVMAPAMVARHRADQDVPVAHVTQFMGEHAFSSSSSSRVRMPASPHRRMRRIPSGREGVGESVGITYSLGIG